MAAPAVVVRPATDADHDEVAQVVRAAFEGEEVPLLVLALRASGHVRVELVAEIDGRVVGHVVLSRSWLDTRARLVDVLVLSPLSVVPDEQRRGTGTTLLAAAVSAAEALGVPAVFLEGSPAWYGARGFDRAADHGFERPSTRIPDRAFQVAVLDGLEPGTTGQFVYCDPFWALDCVGLRDPLLTQVEQQFD